MRRTWGAIATAAACGHAVAPPPPRAAPTPDAALLSAATADAEPSLDSLLPTASLPKTYADAMAHVHPITGPVPGEPALTVTRTPDPTRCGGEDVVVTRDRKVAVVDPLLVTAIELDAPPADR